MKKHYIKFSCTILVMFSLILIGAGVSAQPDSEGLYIYEDFSSGDIDNFFQTSSRWSLASGNINIPHLTEEKSAVGERSLRLHWDDHQRADRTTSPRLNLNFDRQTTGKLAVSFKVLLDSAEQRNLVFRLNSSSHGIHLYSSRGQLVAYDGAAANVGAFRLGEWNDVDLLIDLDNFTYTIELNGVPGEQTYNFRTKEPISRIQLFYQVNSGNLTEPSPEVFVDEIIIQTVQPDLEAVQFMQQEQGYILKPVPATLSTQSNNPSILADSQLAIEIEGIRPAKITLFLTEEGRLVDQQVHDLAAGEKLTLIPLEGELEGGNYRLSVRFQEETGSKIEHFFFAKLPTIDPTTDALKVLAIGNSFSDDSVEHLYQIAEDIGEKMIVGHLMIGGAPLERHWDRARNNTAAYNFSLNVDGSWFTIPEQTMQFGLQFTDWDVITIQQVSGQSGIASSYTANNVLDNLVNYINQHKTNPDAKLAWNMTWAYQGDSTHRDFPRYQNNQMVMYNAIVNATQNVIVPHDGFDIVIPAGTAMQNVRTSFIGDTVTRDGYHLSRPLGRYIASMLWVHSIAGWPIDDVTWVPNKTQIPDEYLPPIKEGVKAAVQNPFTVTESSYSTRP